MRKQNRKSTGNRKTMPDKGNVRNRSSKSKVGKEELDTSKSSNNPEWYAANPVILNDAASIPFSWPTGASDIVNPTEWSGVGYGPYSKIPGILSLKVVPAVGTATLATDPINVAAQSVYSFVRHANSGHANYDSPDLMLYILAMANFYAFLVWVQRAYGFAMTYDQRNRYIPRELLRTDNIDPDSLINNLANFRFWMNTLIAKAASFAVPATMSIFSRMAFMYSGLYVEGTSIKDQLYKFVPDGFYQFNINSGTSLGELIYQKLDRSQLMSVSDIMTYGDTLFNAIWSQEDFGIMSGDILKAYGDRIIKLSPVPELYSIVPQFDPMVLTQMKNARLLYADPSSIGQGPSGNLIQTVQPHLYTTSDKALDGNNYSSADVAGMNRNRLHQLKDWKALTVDTDNPTPDVVMEATRLIYGYDDYLAYVRCGTEFIDEAIITYDVGSDDVLGQLNCVALASYADVASSWGKYLSHIRSFHYMPQTWWISMIGSTPAGDAITQIFDVDNFAILDNADIIKMHQAATINMLAVPSVAKV